MSSLFSECKACGTQCGHAAFTFCTQVERDEAIENGIETDILFCEGLADFCLACGDMAAVREALEARLFMTRAGWLEPCPLCAKCRKRRVDLSEWHLSYTIALDTAAGFEILKTELLYIGHLCPECSPAAAQKAGRAELADAPKSTPVTGPQKAPPVPQEIEQ
jgi:hypothetical protein